MTALTNRRQIAIEWGHCDPAGMVYICRFFEFFDWSTILLFQKALGMLKSEMMLQFAADMPLVGTKAKFFQPAKFGDVVEIVSSATQFRRSSFDVEHQLFKDGELIAEAQETRVWINWAPDMSGPLTSKPIPAGVIERFKIP